VIARHLPRRGAGLEGLLAHRTVSPASGDRHRRHRLHRSLRCRRPGRSRLQPRELVEQAVEPGPHKEVRDIAGQRPQTFPRSVVVVELEPGERSAPEHDDRVHRPAPAAPADAPKRRPGELLQEAAVAVRAGDGRRRHPHEAAAVVAPVRHRRRSHRRKRITQPNRTQKLATFNSSQESKTATGLRSKKSREARRRNPQIEAAGIRIGGFEEEGKGN
jgi:hypothetical protein